MKQSPWRRLGLRHWTSDEHPVQGDRVGCRAGPLSQEQGAGKGRLLRKEAGAWAVQGSKGGRELGTDLGSQRQGARMEGNVDKNIPEEGRVSWALEPPRGFKS